MRAALFEKIKQSVLGKKYDLSVAFLSPTQMRAVTKKTKNKNKASNVLAFPLSPTSGEILLCIETAKKEAPLYNMSQRNFLTYLFIHGLLHLQGLDHGATMEDEERRIMKRFGLSVYE